MGAEDDCFHRQKFEHITSLLESSYPSLGLLKKEIEGWFSKLNHTPDHPPYDSMIERAITELNEQGGSTEEMIAKFIEAEYEDLPIAHTSLLTHHLQKLVKKGDIVCSSGNYYVLSIENSGFHKLKKGRKHLKMRCGKGRQNGRHHKIKGAQSKKGQKLEVGQEQNQVNAKIFGVEEQKQAEDKQIGPTGEQKQQRHEELIEGHGKVEELQFKLLRKQAEAKQDKEGNEEYDQRQELLKLQEKDLNLQQSQLLGETGDLLVEENNQAEDTNHVKNHNGITELEHQKGQKNYVIEEQCHEEQRSEKLEEKIQFQDQESEAREKQVQLPEIQTEAMVEQINPLGKKIEVIEEETRLQQQQQMEVCFQIIDLRNMMLHFMKKEKKDEPTLSSQSYVTSQNMDLSGLSYLTKEECLELLEKTNKVAGKLIHFIASLNMEASDNNKSKSKMGEKHELREKYIFETKDLCIGRPQEEQQPEVCDQLQVSEYQPITTPASEILPTHAMQLEQNTQIDLPTHKRLPEVEITCLEELCEKQYKQIKLSDQQQAPKCQTKSKTISLDMPCDALCDEAEMVIRRKISVPEDNSLSTEPHSKFSGEASTSMPETKNSYLAGFIEQLQISQHCGQEKLPESQLFSSSLNVLQELSLEHQQQTTSNNEAKEAEQGNNNVNQQPENAIEGIHIEYELTAVEHQFQSQQQMSEQQQQSLLQSLGEKPCKPQLAADTSAGKQFDQSKQMQRQHQQGQLNPRGSRPSESEQVLTTIEDVHYMTLASPKSEMNQKPKPSITKKPRETAIELSKPTEQQMKHHGQKKQFKYQPTITAVDSAITCVQLQKRQLRPQSQGPSPPDLVVQKTREESLPLQLKPKRQGRGRPPKPKTNADATLVLDHWNHKEEQPQHRDQGRPPNSKLTSTMDAS